MATRFHNKGLDGMASSTVSFAVVVDDDLFILMHACDILGAAGFRFHEAGTEEEAKTLLADHADDVTLLFSDLEMPGDTDGFALAHYFAEHWPWIEIVIASGNVTPCPGTCPTKRRSSANRSTIAWFTNISGRSFRTTSNPSSSSRRFSSIFLNL